MAVRLTTTREERGQTIAQHTGQVKRIDEGFYAVKSQSGNGEYAVTRVDSEWICECPDNKYRGAKCKHIFAVQFSKTLRAEVSVRRIEPISNLTECIYCSSRNLTKKGIRKNKTGAIQKFLCHDCHKYMTFNVGFERMKHNPQAITSAMQLYFSGESLRNTMESLKLLGVEVSYRTILNWIRKYTRLMQGYAEKIVPNVSNTWRADEIRIKVMGDMKYLFAVMDDETRFWIAQEVADTKHYHDTRNLFLKAKQLMGKQPKTIVTDGLYSFCGAAEVVLDEAKHVRHVRLRGDVHNNKMERLNGEIRDREKTMRGLKQKNTPILSGYQLFHNYIRPHEALSGKTPAEACGITIEGENKWKTLIQNASKIRREV
ncbi:MAG: transposase [Candidatus Bathyarchaeia archaeon]